MTYCTNLTSKKSKVDKTLKKVKYTFSISDCYDAYM
ncbi:hypothetical protein FHS60_002198 [Alloprevotella rava]|uniref:Uncharacterized protein n=1 Tax=Alloprevotella rava TaxID=671218 RepID=A0A7W5ULU1_9BACT|nr:hypothetical protein [Alloprevotella rava]